MRLLENWTGFLNDVQEPTQTPHVQRGDLIDFHFDELTLGGRGFARWHGEALGPAAGVRGRLLRARRPDDVDAVPRHGGQPGPVPHRRGSHLDARRHRRLRRREPARSPGGSALRGGVRADMFLFDVLNNCAVNASVGVDSPSKPVPRGRPALPERARARRLPRADPALVDGQRRRHAARHARRSGRSITSSSRSARATASARSIPSYVAQGLLTPFVNVQSQDLGVSYDNQLGSVGPRGEVGLLPHALGPGSALRSERGPQHARQRLDAHGLVRLGAGARDLLRRRRERDGREGDVRRHASARALRARSRAPGRRRVLPRPALAARPQADPRHRRVRRELRRAAAAPYSELSDVIFISDASREPRVEHLERAPRGAEPLRLQVQARRVQLRLRLPLPGRAHARARALVHGGGAADHHAARSARRSEVRREACASSRSSRSFLPGSRWTRATGRPATSSSRSRPTPPGASGAGDPFSVNGYTIQLTYAQMYVGAIYVNEAPAARAARSTRPRASARASMRRRCPDGVRRRSPLHRRGSRSRCRATARPTWASAGSSISPTATSTTPTTPASASPTPSTSRARRRASRTARCSRGRRP